jgi:hypothetical protein
MDDSAELSQQLKNRSHRPTYLYRDLERYDKAACTSPERWQRGCGPCWLNICGVTATVALRLRVSRRLIQKIENGLAHRYLHSSDFPGDGVSQNRLYIDGTAINGRISASDKGPTVVVDGHEYSWEEFGGFLTPLTGFNFRLECFDACEEPETSPDPPAS